MQQIDDVALPHSLETIKTLDIGDKDDVFASTSNTPLPMPNWERTLDRQNFTQQNIVRQNGQIILNDGTYDRMLIGYDKDGF